MSMVSEVKVLIIWSVSRDTEDFVWVFCFLAGDKGKVFIDCRLSVGA